MSRELCDALATWRLHRTDFHASIVDRLSNALTRTRPAFPDSQWHEVCAAGDPVDLGVLLASLPPATDPALHGRLDALRGFPADPRIAQALRWLLCCADDLGAPRHRPLWRRVFGMLASMGDPRVRGWLPELVAHQRGATPAFGHWLAGQVAAVTDAMPATPREPPVVHVPADECPWIASMAREERLVTADWLSQCGDPLGEFLVLQLATEGLGTQARRARELVRMYGRRWLGPLSMAVRPDGLRFEAGVVVAGTLSGRRALELTGHAGWTSFQELDLRALRFSLAGSELRRFLTHRVLRALRSLQAVPAALLPAVLETRMGVTSLEVLDWVRPGLVDACWRVMPQLERVKANGAWTSPTLNSSSAAQKRVNSASVGVRRSSRRR